MKLVQEFKTFINKGNIIDLSVAVIIGGAFGKIVTSMTKDIIMPVLSLITGEQGFENYKYVITEANEAEGIMENAIYYGTFLQNVFDFLIIAFVIFFFLRLVQRASAAAEKAKAEIVELKDAVLDHPKVEDVLLDIKDLLQKNSDDSK
jgi:large conductance mechanosensitive channel